MLFFLGESIDSSYFVEIRLVDLASPCFGTLGFKGLTCSDRFRSCGSQHLLIEPMLGK